jgi:hypothetical protein
MEKYVNELGAEFLVTDHVLTRYGYISKPRSCQALELQLVGPSRSHTAATRLLTIGSELC